MADVDSEELMAGMQQLSKSINNLVAMFKTASENIISEPDSSKIIIQKLDKLIKQDEEIAKSLLLLLDLEKEHLPLITSHTRQAAEIRTPTQMHFSMRHQNPISAMRTMPVSPPANMQRRVFGPPPQMQKEMMSRPATTLPPDLEMDLPELEPRQQRRRLFG